LTWQLRGWCGDRQADSPKYALQHNIGLGGAVVVTLYKRMDDEGRDAECVDPRKRLGYNPAIEHRRIEGKDLKKVMSKTGGITSNAFKAKI